MNKKNYIDQVKTPLGLIVFGTLILETFLGAAMLNIGDKQFVLIQLMVGFVVLMIVISLLVSWLKPEALQGERYTKPESVDSVALVDKIKNLEAELSIEKSKYQSLVEKTKILKDKQTPEHLKNIEHQIVNHCSPRYRSTFRELCTKMGVEDTTSEQAKEISIVLGSMKADGLINENQILRN